MQSQTVWIEVDDQIRLEAVYHPAEGQPKGGILALHPHPLYGGSMDDFVVLTILEAATREGWAGLRFNFRGVGASGGRHDDGEGEQQDVRAAFKWLRDQVQAPLVLSGYSFGARVGSYAAPSLGDLNGGILVSPPFILGSMGDWPQDAGDMLVISGSADQFGSSALVEEWLKKQSAPNRWKLVNGQDHFWFGNQSVLNHEVREFLQQLAI